jgi:hypothetical protein
MKALAYYNWGRWVVDCPVPGCGDARALHPEDHITGIPSAEPMYEQVCAAGHPITIEMPPGQEAARIEVALSERADGDKGWYPKGHARAEAQGFPTGQTVAQLTEETREIRATRGDIGPGADEKQHLIEVLGSMGITVGPDGRFEGKI